MTRQGETKMQQPVKEPENPFPIGFTFTLRRGKMVREETVRDYLRTYNSAGELVRFRYVTSHITLGQRVYTYDVTHTTIVIAASREK